MRAYRFDDLNSLDDLKLHEEAMPAPQRGEVLVKVRSVSLNYRDLAVVLGRYVGPSQAGLIPCSDAAVEVAAVGEGVVVFKGAGATVRSIGVGDRAALEDLVRAVSGADIKPVVDRIFDFEGARHAFDRLQSGGHVGKIVIQVSS